MNQDRILVPLSFASDSNAAFERALALAQTSGAELYLLHAVPADQRFSFGAAERLRRSIDLRKRAEAASVTVQTVEQQGDPVAIIVLHAESRQVNLIVMASERRSGWARLRQPSVAEGVLRRTKRPTLVIRDDETGRDSVVNNDRPLLAQLGADAVRTLRNTDRAVLAVPPEAARQALSPEDVIHQRAA